MNLERHRGTVRSPHVPTLMRSAGKPMDSLRGLHDAKFADTMAPVVILDEGADGDVAGQEALWEYSFLSNPCYRYAGSASRREALEVHRGLCRSGRPKRVLQPKFGLQNGGVRQVRRDPLFGSSHVGPEFVGGIARMPMGAVTGLALDMVTADGTAN